MYHMIGGESDPALSEMAMLWVLNQSDGTNSQLDIAERSGIRFNIIRKAACALQEKQLLQVHYKSIPSATR